MFYFPCIASAKKYVLNTIVSGYDLYEKKNKDLREYYIIMPGYKGHLVGGIIAFGLLFVGLMSIFMSQQPSHLMMGEWLLCTLAGALFPDIDVKSKGQKYFYYVVLVGIVVLAYQQQFQMLTCFSVVMITPMLVRHRGIFHSPRFVIALPLLVWVVIATLLPQKASHFFVDTLFFIGGALSHLWLDFGTRQFLSRLLPRRKKRW
jgi:membrane-bound metal-dependent hydrolase YbcI (DUF457 family)